MSFYTFIPIVFCFGTLSQASDWGYPTFPKWSGVCDEGRRQSPINLDADESISKSFDRLELKNYREPLMNLTMVNNGHTIEVKGFEYELTLSGGFLQDEFVLDQFHFHWDSEHTVNDIRYPLELHFVHRNIKYPNFVTALNYKDGVVVIGALYHVSHTDNHNLEKIIRGLHAVKDYDKINQPALVGEALVLDYLVPTIGSYYTYSGSLTTPTCVEDITWIVLKQTYPVSMKQVNKFKEIEYHKGEHLRNNFRELQEKGDREVIFVSEAPGLMRLSMPIFTILTFVVVNHKIPI